jgi:hypothetical protein
MARKQKRPPQTPIAPLSQERGPMPSLKVKKPKKTSRGK